MEEADRNLSEILGVFHFSEVTKKKEGKEGRKEGKKEGRKEGRERERKKEKEREREGGRKGGRPKLSYQNCVLFSMFTFNS